MIPKSGHRFSDKIMLHYMSLRQRRIGSILALK